MLYNNYFCKLVLYKYRIAIYIDVYFNVFFNNIYTFVAFIIYISKNILRKLHLIIKEYIYNFFVFFLEQLFDKVLILLIFIENKLSNKITFVIYFDNLFLFSNSIILMLFDSNIKNKLEKT